MKQIFTLFLLLTIFSCGKNPDQSTNQFKGDWKGTYSGTDDSGAFEIIIDANGNVTGRFNSYQFILETYQLTGVVDDKGTITLTFGTASPGGTFTGILNNTIGSGTWENKITTPNYSGTWIGQKQ